jgi:hypothetical protein
VHRLDAIVLLSSAVFAGMVLVSAESALEYVIAGLIGLILGGLFPLAPGESHSFAFTWLACAVPLFVAMLILPRLLKRHPGNLLNAGLLPVLWAVVGQQKWSVPPFRPWPLAAIGALVAIVALRVLLGRLPVPQTSKFGYLLALFMMATGVLLLLY